MAHDEAVATQKIGKTTSPPKVRIPVLVVVVLTTEIFLVICYVISSLL